MDIAELNVMLDLHKKWLNNEAGGERAILINKNLRFADLKGANLNEADLKDANLRFADLKGANLNEADLRFADLRSADLNEADLKGANLDFSCLPLWCGSLGAWFDDRQLAQIAYHLVKAGLNSPNASESTKAELRKLIDFANTSHLTDECGIICRESDDEEEKE